MKTNTKRNGNPQDSLSQNKQLSFYEENYILEPENADGDTDDNELSYVLGFMDFSFN
jgi:hypothetical protein